jgi:deoxycytidylate deaminase
VKFTGTFEELKEKLNPLLGNDWEESQPNKKVIRRDGGILNWYPSTGSLLFQGKPHLCASLEADVLHALEPDEFPEPIGPVPKPILDERSEPLRSASAAKHLRNDFKESELIFGVVSAIGTDSNQITIPLKDRLVQFGYVVTEIRVSSLLPSTSSTFDREYERIKELISEGDQFRKLASDNSILGLGVAKKISESRDDNKRRAYIVNSLKHPDEVDVLRKIYGSGFYLLGIHAASKRRINYLKDEKCFTQIEAEELIKIDENEDAEYGQRTRDTFHKSDFFLNLGGNTDQIRNSLQRILDLIFSHPYKTPTFDEFAMFMAFSSSVRSADLSRQVGAVLTKNSQIIATGANDCPQFGGGLYWAKVNPLTGKVTDAPSGKDYTRKQDSNKAEQLEIIDDIMSKIKKIEDSEHLPMEKLRKIVAGSRIRDLTEFGRVVHAEMETLLSCARAGIDTNGSTLYCTTFPCHNCAKHIIAAGIKRVVYVEPYPKSKALDFHEDSIFLKEVLEIDVPENMVIFEPFSGVGARRFLDLFSMALGSGSKLKRKDKNGTTFEWVPSEANLRVPLLPCSYLNLEDEAKACFDSAARHQQTSL